jgi:hypothetical protein
MIDAGPSLKAALGFPGPALVPYLIATGWSSRPSRVDGISVFAKSIEGSARPIEFILPVKSGFLDEQRRVADALRTVAELEGRSLSEVAEDMRRAAERDSVATQSVQSGAASGFADFSSPFAEFIRRSHAGPGQRSIFSAVSSSGFEIELMVDEHGRYLAVVRDSENKDRPPRFLVESSSNDLRTDQLLSGVKEEGDLE